MSIESVADAFVQHFYTTLDSTPANLRALYQPQSVLTFEGTKFEGPDAIIAKYQALGQVFHNVGMLTKDVQMCSGTGMLIFVTGQLKIGSAEANNLLFSNTFHLIATAPGQYYIHNEFFRLIYA